VAVTGKAFTIIGAAKKEVKTEDKTYM